ncbi:MAG: hypothetical protein HXY30_04155 [Pseudorhodoplanes sp.]|nr:hypothetical protein [Pseudorhodoplanes sp.]
MKKFLALAAATALMAGSSAVAQTKSDDMKSDAMKSQQQMNAQPQLPNSGAAPATTGAAPRDATGASTPVSKGAGGDSGTASGTTGTDKNPKPASSVR